MNDYKNLNEGAPDAWCPLPWSHVSVKADGSFRVCCHSAASESRGTLLDENKKPLHIQHTKFDQIMNNQTMKDIRLGMLNNKWHDTCIRCKREYDSGISSRNLYERDALAAVCELDVYPSYKKAVELTNSDGSIDNKDFPITFLDIRFGNLCNLKCVMCSPTDSSQWYDDWNAIWGYEYYWESKRKIPLVKNENDKFKPAENIYDWSDDPNIWIEIEKHIDQFRKIYIVGGEPLLIDAHYEFLQECVDRGYADKLTIEYNTNITNVPPRAWNIWKNFENIIIGASIDGFGEVNSLIRFPSNWKQVEGNLNRFFTAEGNFTVHLSYTYQILNAWQFPEFIEYLIMNNVLKKREWRSNPLMLSVHPAHRPHYLNVNILPDEFKGRLKQRYEQYKHKLRTTDYKSLYGNSNNATWEEKVEKGCKELDNYIKFMYTIKYSEEELIKWRSNCIHVLDTLDKTRDTNWKSVCPELYEATLSWRDLPKKMF